jgi:hypothetical protein
VPDNSEEHRHRCEVRTVLRWRVEDRNKAIEYISLVRKRRGEKQADILEKNCREQWKLGNRGENEDWFTKK